MLAEFMILESTGAVVKLAVILSRKNTYGAYGITFSMEITLGFSKYEGFSIYGNVNWFSSFLWEGRGSFHGQFSVMSHVILYLLCELL